MQFHKLPYEVPSIFHRSDIIYLPCWLVGIPLCLECHKNSCRVRVLSHSPVHLIFSFPICELGWHSKVHALTSDPQLGCRRVLSKMWSLIFSYYRTSGRKPDRQGTNGVSFVHSTHVTLSEGGKDIFYFKRIIKDIFSVFFSSE